MANSKGVSWESLPRGRKARIQDMLKQVDVSQLTLNYIHGTGNRRGSKEKRTDTKPPLRCNGPLVSPLICSLEVVVLLFGIDKVRVDRPTSIRDYLECATHLRFVVIWVVPCSLLDDFPRLL
jgi:hypothetical protein